ncbi:MAG: MBL fold metallo-hydrolase [Gammaproteobacteria bacterium]|nr:MBL fold metallo-hydrolase [Gammaproteobacteria bacterium]
MYRCLLICLIGLVPLHANSQKALSDYKAEKISQHVYVIHGPKEMPNPENRGFMNNPAFIVADKGVIIVDPGSTEEVGQMVLNNIKAVTSKPVTHVFNTHIHGDHWLSNDAIKQVFPGITVMADPRMIKKAKAGDAQSWIDLLDRLTEGASQGTEIMYPGKAVTNNDQFKIHNFTFKIYTAGKGHSDSDIMIEFVEDSVLFTGDNVTYQRVVRLDDGGFRDNITACDIAINLNLKHYVPGHGPTGSVDIVKQQKSYLDTLYKKVSQYYDQGQQDFEMKPKVAESLKAFKDWSGFDEQLGKHISLAILEIEQAGFE